MRFHVSHMFKAICWSGLFVATSCQSAPAATFNPLVGFGLSAVDPTTDGERYPGEVVIGDLTGTTNGEGNYKYLGIDNLERGLAYNPVTGNLLLLSRLGDPNVEKGLRILDGMTGADKGFVDFNSTIVNGGTFTRNMIGVADDGAIYMANLTTNTDSSPFKIYRWDSETDAEPSLVYSGAPLAGARMGDTFDVIGSGSDTRIVAGYGNNPSVAGNNGFAIFDTLDGGLSFSATHVSIPGSETNAGDFRLGITFMDDDTVLGRGDGAVSGDATRVVDVSGGTGTLAGNIMTDGTTLRLLDFAVVDGRPLLAVQEASADTTSAAARARVFIYDLTDTSGEVGDYKIAERSALPEGVIQTANINATGQVKFGAINGRTAIVYGMSTNNGIQAFELTLDPLTAGDDADFNGDLIVDGSDFLTWQENFGIDDGSALLADGDANGDGNVDAADLSVWQTQYGQSTAPVQAAVVPEPAGAVLILSGLALMAAHLRVRPRRV